MAEENPDFEKIAHALIDAINMDVLMFDLKGRTDQERRVKIQRQVDRAVDILRSVWNARGDADTAKIETQLSSLLGPTTAVPYCQTLDRALRTLDR